MFKHFNIESKVRSHSTLEPTALVDSDILKDQVEKRKIELYLYDPRLVVTEENFEFIHTKLKEDYRRSVQYLDHKAKALSLTTILNTFQQVVHQHGESRRTGWCFGGCA